MKSTPGSLALKRSTGRPRRINSRELRENPSMDKMVRAYYDSLGTREWQRLEREDESRANFILHRLPLKLAHCNLILVEKHPLATVDIAPGERLRGLSLNAYTHGGLICGGWRVEP